MQDSQRPGGDPVGSNSSNLLDRFFSGLAEYIFHTRLGVADGQLVGYVSDLLVRFTKTDALNRIRQWDGRPANEVFTLMMQAEDRVGVARRDVHRHIGDFTLFWSGLYPESLRKHSGRISDDRFTAYCRHGKTAYAIASEIEPHDEQAVSCELMQAMSEHFELCAFGLREVRRAWESDNDAGDGVLMV